MRIEHVKLSGFRNFAAASVALAEKTLVIGANDVGKTNLLHAIRVLLDRSVSESDIEPLETDFHIPLGGGPVSEVRIEVKLSGIVEDAVISRLKGHISEEGETFLVYTAERETLNHQIHIGHNLDALDEVDGRYYLKHIHFKYVESCRDLQQYIQREKRQLLKIAKQKRSTEEEAADGESEVQLQDALYEVNKGINELSYVVGATASINGELKKISRHHAEYEVGLEAQALNFSNFVERLSLGARSGGRRVGLGGDGRNNQILVGLWKAKSEVEHDAENEAIIYCIEEPEAHLHPHQQRKLAAYLVNELNGQVLVSTHSSQIASAFRPDGIVRLLERGGSTVAAAGGCSECIDEAWKDLGYRMSIVPAEAFFSDAVLLVEGPSEVLFYHELARQLAIDLDFHNVSVLSVDGVDFEVYVTILDAMEIPWVLRTDNDVCKVPRSDPPMWRFAGLNRALRLAKETEYDDDETIDTPEKLEATWAAEADLLNRKGIYVSRVDLETDLGNACATALMEYAEADTVGEAVYYLQGRKAIRMGEFLAAKGAALDTLKDDALALPLRHVVHLSEKRREEAAAAAPGFDDER
jgi:putative ATP-dependent endonuclease of the OLD family